MYMELIYGFQFGLNAPSLEILHYEVDHHFCIFSTKLLLIKQFNFMKH